MTYDVIFSPRARRALTGELPETVAAACLEFIAGPLAENPRRVGKPLRNELSGTFSARRGEYRVAYDIDAERNRVEVIDIRHRRAVYRA